MIWVRGSAAMPGIVLRLGAFRQSSNVKMSKCKSLAGDRSSDCAIVNLCIRAYARIRCL
jgi:hypothetical protein